MKRLPAFLLFFYFALMANAQEVCNNGIDDDELIGVAIAT